MSRWYKILYTHLLTSLLWCAILAFLFQLCKWLLYWLVWGNSFSEFLGAAPKFPAFRAVPWSIVSTFAPRQWCQDCRPMLDQTCLHVAPVGSSWWRNMRIFDEIGHEFPLDTIHINSHNSVVVRCSCRITFDVPYITSHLTVPQRWALGPSLVPPTRHLGSVVLKWCLWNKFYWSMLWLSPFSNGRIQKLCQPYLTMIFPDATLNLNVEQPSHCNVSRPFVNIVEPPSRTSRWVHQGHIHHLFHSWLLVEPQACSSETIHQTTRRTPIKLHYITLHYITLHYCIILYYIILYYYYIDIYVYRYST